MTMLNHHRRGSGEPLLLVHGIGSRWQVWSPVLKRLEAERDVIAVDLPGYGSSAPGRPGTPPGIMPLADALERFLDDLEIETAHVGGNSLGGRLALELAARGRARSVTALSPAGFYNEREAAFMRLSLLLTMRVARAVQPAAERLLSSTAIRSLLCAQLVGRPWKLSVQDAVGSTRALTSSSPRFQADLEALAVDRFRGGAAITVPVVIAWGKRDRLLIPRQGPRATRAIPGSRLVILPGGHVPTYDEPRLVSELLLEGSRPALTARR